MNVTLSAADLARCEAASRAMLSPLAAPSVDAWRQEVNRTMRELFRGDGTIFMLPDASTLYYSDDASSVADDLYTYAELTPDGMHMVHDPVVGLWHDLRRSEHVEAFSWSLNAHMIGQHGHEMLDSDMVRDVLAANGLRDFAGIYTTAAAGEVLLWILSERAGSSPFGEEGALALLRAMVPSLKAGLDALGRLDAHRGALDHVGEALSVFDEHGRELHRNAAFGRMVGEEPERGRLQEAVRHVALQLLPYGFPLVRRQGETPLAPSTRTVETRGARYVISGTVASPGAFAPGAAVLVSVVREATPVLPAPDTLRERHGLTRREAEVALLLAEGLSNDELADRLFISPHTARRHTENVFSKLGINSRKALALHLMQA